MNVNQTNLEPPGSKVIGTPAQSMASFIEQSHRLLDATRASLIRADARYREQRASIIDRMQDELQRLDAQHDKTIADHQTIIGKLEELRR